MVLFIWGVVLRVEREYEKKGREKNIKGISLRSKNIISYESSEVQEYGNLSFTKTTYDRENNNTEGRKGE